MRSSVETVLGSGPGAGGSSHSEVTDPPGTAGPPVRWALWGASLISCCEYLAL